MCCHTNKKVHLSSHFSHISLIIFQPFLCAFPIKICKLEPVHFNSNLTFLLKLSKITIHFRCYTKSLTIEELCPKQFILNFVNILVKAIHLWGQVISQINSFVNHEYQQNKGPTFPFLELNSFFKSHQFKTKQISQH